MFGGDSGTEMLLLFLLLPLIMGEGDHKDHGWDDGNLLPLLLFMLLGSGSILQSSSEE